MFNMRKNVFVPLVATTILLSPLSVFAADGKAIFVIGKVKLVNQNGTTTRLKRGGEINQGDLIITNANSQMQIRMSDGTLLAVRPNSRFLVDTYSYKKDVRSDKSYFNLIKGGIRSITGNIGHAKKSAYRLNTVVGTIGIRGTDYSARLCNSDCGTMKNGLYVGVMQGGIILRNNSGSTLNVDPGNYGFMQNSTTAPAPLNSMPGDLLFADSTATSPSTLAESSSTNASASSQPVENAVPQHAILVALETASGVDLINHSTSSDISSMTNSGITLPSSGSATYNVVSNSQPTDGTNLGTLNTSTTSLNVDFVNSNATANVGFNINNSNWQTSTAQTMQISSGGSFSGNLTGTSTDISGFGTSSSATGLVSGNLSGSAESTIGAPSNANMSYNVTNGTATVTGNISLAVGSTTK